jgi:hypothetical protein
MSERYPEWRLGQMICNVSSWAGSTTAVPVWDLEDDQLLETIQRHLTKVKSSSTQISERREYSPNSCTKTLYSVGDCPVCSVSGAILVFISISTGQPVFYCPSCGTAWRKPPEPHRLDEINSLQEVAPEGVRLPSKEELSKFSLGSLTPLDYQDWAGQLFSVLHVSRFRQNHKAASCVTSFTNDSPNGLRLQLEPEGFHFILPAHETIQIHLFGHDSPAVIRQSVDENGQVCISFSPDKGDYELFFKGRRVWDLI